MATFSYEELEMRYNPYTKQIEQIDVSDAELEQFRADIEINQDNIELKVSSDEILSQINLSTEGVYIKGDRIAIDGQTTFSAGYDPLDKIDLGDAAKDVNLNSTTINGGKITTGSLTAEQIDVDDLFAENITATGTILGAKITTGADGYFYSGDNTNYIDIRDNYIRIGTENVDTGQGSVHSIGPAGSDGWNGIAINGDLFMNGNINLNGNRLIDADGELWYDGTEWWKTDDSGTTPLGSGGSSSDYGRDVDGKFQLPVGTNLY